MTLQHIVLFSFPDGPTDEQTRDIRAHISQWPGAIPGIQALRFGSALFDERTRGYQFLLYMEFAGLEDLRTYQAHPIHQKFLSWVIENNITPLAFDYHLDDETVLVPATRELSTRSDDGPTDC